MCFFINIMFIFRPFPFRLQNENTGEALSLWHLTSPAPPAPLHVASTETGPEVMASSLSTTENQQRSFVLRRHALTGPLLPLHLVPAAISNTVCLQVHLCKFFSIISYKNFFTLLLLLQKLFAFWFYNNKLSYVHISHLCRQSKGSCSLLVEVFLCSHRWRFVVEGRRTAITIYKNLNLLAVTSF